MRDEAKYFMGDVFAGDVNFGFLVSDRREGAVETTTDEKTARSIVGGRAAVTPILRLALPISLRDLTG